MIGYYLQLIILVVVSTIQYLCEHLCRLVFGPKIYAEEDVQGKVVVITGANSGVGKAAAVALARRGMTVIMGCRNLVAGKKAQEEISTLSKASPGQVDLIHLDLADLSSVRKFAKTVNKNYPLIHILINNAGFYDGGDVQRTKDNFEAHIGVNHLGHFLLTHLLLDTIKRGAPSRIICVSSTSQIFANLNPGNLNMENMNRGLGNMLPYCNSKHANSLFAKQLGRKLRGTDVTTYSLCPGVVRSEFYRSLDSWAQTGSNIFLALMGIAPEQGAEVIVYCAVSKEAAESTGLFYRFSWPNNFYNNFIRRNKQIGLQLWDESERLVGLK